MKIRILDPGFANLTGLFGVVEFVNGVSVEEVSSAEAARMGTIIKIEDADTNLNPSTTQLMVDQYNKNAEEVGFRPANLQRATTTQPEVAEDQPEVLEQADVSGKSLTAPVKVLSYDYTETDLDDLVKKEGIAGLRSFAEAYDVNDRSVAGLVQKLMELKAFHQPVKQVEPIVPVEPVVVTDEQTFEEGLDESELDEIEETKE